MQYRDYYQILGVQRSATEKEIKRAYRQLARKHHPDVNPGKRAEERFKEINEAYEVLSDPEQRRKYDELDAHGREAPGGRAGGRGPGAPGSGQPHVKYADLDDLLGGTGDSSELLQNLFRARGRRSAPGNEAPGWFVRGAAFEYATPVTLEEAFRGVTRQLIADGRTVEVRIPPGVRTGSRIAVSVDGGADVHLVVEVLPHPRFTVDGHDLR
ncbi:MAG TPA: hypothetical protein DCM14_08000, partial [Clostridiales bacterium UBA8153]|nr:hypothetical protein [Clostridiales bacterium UBA8153]